MAHAVEDGSRNVDHAPSLTRHDEKIGADFAHALRLSAHLCTPCRRSTSDLMACLVHAGSLMACKLVTCPESAHLEMIIYEDTPLGLLIDACTRFQPGCMMKCPRTCAARLDRRFRDGIDLDIGDSPQR
jgi:hypothetical protein